MKGPDAERFLHDLLPANILERPCGSPGAGPIYTAFLSAQGRILHDVFVYAPPKDTPEPGDWYIEVDAESTGSLLKHLKKHKLRSKFALAAVPPDQLAVYYVWPSPSLSTPNPPAAAAASSSSSPAPSERRIGGPDPRPGLGSRFLFPPSSAPGALGLNSPSSAWVESTVRDYTVHRMLNGIAEGSPEIVSGGALPQESNIDFFTDGIDFHKGCYLGQELTIRTHHTGVVRKRILPCQLYANSDDASDSASSPSLILSLHPLEQGQKMPIYHPEIGEQAERSNGSALPPTGANLSRAREQRKGRSVGKWLGGVGDIGLALCRLEMVTDVSVTSTQPSTTTMTGESSIGATISSDEHQKPGEGESTGAGGEEFQVTWEGDSGHGVTTATANGKGQGPSQGSNRVKVKPFMPPWLREKIVESIERRERRPTKPQQRHLERDEEGDGEGEVVE